MTTLLFAAMSLLCPGALLLISLSPMAFYSMATAKVILVSFSLAVPAFCANWLVAVELRSFTDTKTTKAQRANKDFKERK